MHDLEESDLDLQHVAEENCCATVHAANFDLKENKGNIHKAIAFAGESLCK